MNSMTRASVRTACPPVVGNTEVMRAMATERTIGERIRIRHAIARLRTILDQVESTLDVDAPPSPDVGQAIAHSGSDIACSIARLEAYMRAELDTHLKECAP
jgi:hypothetical protein